MKLSFIFPVFNEEANLQELYQRLADTASNIDGQAEFIFVDDSSVDRTPDILKELHQKDKRVKVIRFSTNFGGHAAIAAGLHYCTGDCAVAMASDLQDPPELAIELLNEWKKGGQVVWGVRNKREGESFSTKLFSRVYYFLINRMTNVKMPPLGTDVFLIDRKVIDAFKLVREKHSSIYMTIGWLGFTQKNVEYTKTARNKGESGWTLGKKVKLLLDSILSFSDIPIRYMSVSGFFIAAVGFVYALCVIWGYFNGRPVEGWPSLMVAILIIGGVQMMTLGLLGEYLWRTFDESRQRPRYIVEYTIE